MLNTVLILAVIILIVVYIFRLTRKDYHSNWAQLLPNFKFSTKEFYQLVKAEMSNHGISDLSFEEVSLKTGNIFSSYRLYLRVSWGEYFYDLCFAPFGDGCFVSWWLIFETSETEIFLSKIPIVGDLLIKVFYRKTYYKVDSASMFMTYAQHSVLKVIDEITKETGFRLTEDQRIPKLNDLFKR